MRRIILVSLLILLAGVIHAAERPNIIFILADDLGYGDVGCYGQKRILTPHIDGMAAEGMKFTQFYSGSTVCAPSRCVLMTGKHTGRCHIRGNGKSNLRPEDVTIAEVLKKAGYATGHIGKWGLGHEGSQALPTHKGFDSFLGYLDHTHAHNYYPTFLVRNDARVKLKNVVPEEGKEGQGVATEKLEYSHDIFAEEALKWLDANKEKTFFLYLAVTPPHANNEAKNKGMEVPDYGSYKDLDWPEAVKGHAAMISRMDRDIGRILARLKEHGIDQKTLVVFTSDNGPHREGGNDPGFNDSNGQLRGIKRDLYDGGIRVPFIARWPGKIKAGSQSDHIGYFADVMPTLAEIAGTEVPKETDGISIAPTLLGGGEQKQHEFLYWEFYEQGSRQAVRMGPWKAIRQPMLTGKVELYDITKDIGEEKNVAEQNPEIVAKAVAAMEKAHVPSPDWKVKPPAPKK